MTCSGSEPQASQTRARLGSIGDTPCRMVPQPPCWSWHVVLDIALLGGLLLWIFGRVAVHIGASGLISGLTAFLIVAGLLEQRIIPLLIALIVGFLYGGSLILGVIPRFGSNISWDGHLFGAIAGGIVAYALARETTKQPAKGKPIGQDRMLDL